MILADCHVHSEFSSDSDAPVVKMLEQAVHLGMPYFYLTDHHDIDFPVDAAGGTVRRSGRDTDRRRAWLNEEYSGEASGLCPGVSV